MSTRRKLAWLAAVALALAIGVWLYVTYSPTRAVIRRFEDLAEALTFTEARGPLQSAIAAATVRDLLTDPVLLRTPLHGLDGSFSPSEATAQLVGVQSYFVMLVLEFADFTIAFPTRDTALVTVTGRLRGFSKSGEEIDEIRELHGTLVRADGSWRFSQCDVIDVVEK